MKKTTLIIVIILCGIVGLKAQSASNPTSKHSTEATYSQSNNVSDNENDPKFTVSGKILSVKNLENGVQVDIYSVLGAKVFTYKYSGNPVTLNLNKGIYIVRVGKYTQKIIL